MPLKDEKERVDDRTKQSNKQNSAWKNPSISLKWRVSHIQEFLYNKGCRPGGFSVQAHL